MKPDTNLPDVVQYSPQKQLALFAHGRIALWMGLALGLHLLLIGGTSIGFIRDKWIDPEGAEARQAAAAAAAKKSPPKSRAPAATVPTPATATNAATAAASSKSDQATLQQRKETPVVKRITSVASTNEIPKSPDDIGLSLHDTDVK